MTIRKLANELYLSEAFVNATLDAYRQDEAVYRILHKFCEATPNRKIAWKKLKEALVKCKLSTYVAQFLMVSSRDASSSFTIHAEQAKNQSLSSILGLSITVNLLLVLFLFFYFYTDSCLVYIEEFLKLRFL